MTNSDMTSRTIELVIVEDQREVREGLRYLLELDRRIRVQKTFDRSEDLLKHLEGSPLPDLVLMDIGLPGGMDGIEATKRLRAAFPGINIIILTVFEDEEKLLASIRAGANGYILKNTKPEILLEQILSAVADGSPVSPQVARRLLEKIKREGCEESHEDYGLTCREKEILRAVAEGLTYRGVAEKYHIAASTAKKHILHIYQKLDVKTKTEFVRKAIREKLI